jgi:hypothetical protein
MKTRLFILFTLLSYQIGIAQIPHKGVVLDAFNEQPIMDVNVMVVNKSIVLQTDNKGRFTIPCSVNDSIQFSHLTYNTVKLKGKQLTDTIFMLENTFELTGVIISAETALSLLKKAVDNLFNNLDTKVNIPYQLFHEDKMDGEIVRMCNAEMLFSITGQKKNKEIIDKWYLSKMISKKPDTSFCASYPWMKKKLNLRTEPSISYFMDIFKKNYKKLLYEKEIDNDSLIVIRTFPKKKTGNGFKIIRFYIDKKDTIWFKRTEENNAPLEDEKIKYKNEEYKHRITQFQGYEEYKKGKAGYYYDSLNFYVEHEFQDLKFRRFSQLVILKSSEPEPYDKEKIPKIKQHHVGYSSYLYDYEVEK